MTDDLLDEATRLADSDWPPAARTIPVLRALVERVQQAEADLNERIIANQVIARREAGVIAERDAARGKLDKVRVHVGVALSGDDKTMAAGVRLVQHHTALREVLAILDRKTGD